MKRIISFMMLFAAAMALSSCQKQETDALEMDKVEGLNFSAEKPKLDDESRTEWTGETIQWSKGDAIRVAYTCDGVWQNSDGTATREEEEGKKTAKLYASSELSEASASAKFAVPDNFKGEASGIYEFYAVYPSGSAVKDSDFPHAPSLTVDIPSKQTPLSGSFDPSADLMAAKSVETFEGLPKESISLLWTRVVAHGHLTLKNLQTEDGEKLQTIRLTADADADMVGHHNLYLDTYDVAKANGNNAANTLTIKANNLTIEEGGNVTFWTCFLPCTWKSLEVVVDTDRATYTRAIDLTGKEKTFVRNARNTLGINMASADKVRKGIPSLPFVKDFSGITGTSLLTELDGFSALETVYKATGAIRLASGKADGLLSTVALDLSEKFHVIVTACGWDEDEVKMTVSAGDQTNDVDLTTYGAAQKPGAWVDYVMNFAPVDSIASVQFSAVKNARYFIQKIQILPGHADLPSVLLATAPSKMSQAGGKGEFSYTLKNPKDGFEVTATESVDWIDSLTVDQETKTVSYTVAENTSAEAREATVTLSYDGIDPVEVLVTQAGKSVWVSKSFAELKEGDQVVIVSTKGNSIYAMPNDGGTDAPRTITVAYANNKLSAEPNEIIVWYVGVDGSNRIFYASSYKTTWLYCTNSSSDVKVGTNANKTFAFDEVTGYLKHIGTDPSKYLGVYNNQDWRCYTNTTNYIKEQTFQFFVKSSGESGGGQPEPEPVKLGTPVVNCDETKTTENSLTFTWAAVENATNYKVECNGETVEQTENTYTATGLSAGTEYTVSVTALGDGASYINSDAGTCTATTKEAQPGGDATQYTVTYTVTSSTSVTMSGDAPEGSSATFVNTHTSNKQRMTAGDSQTYTLSGYDGFTITGITLSMKSNKTSGAGSLSVKSGSVVIASIADSEFSADSWYGNYWSQEFVDITPAVTEQAVGDGENVVVQIKASANSLYCQSITITYKKSKQSLEDPSKENTDW